MMEKHYSFKKTKLSIFGIIMAIFVMGLLSSLEKEIGKLGDKELITMVSSLIFVSSLTLLIGSIACLLSVWHHNKCVALMHNQKYHHNEDEIKSHEKRNIKLNNHSRSKEG